MLRNKTQLLLVMIFLLALIIGATIMTHNMLTRPYPGHNDFLSRWEGARSFWIDGLNPYGEQASLNIQMKIFGRPVQDGEDPGYFAYPFYTVVLIWPLVYMDYAWASALWMVLLAACLIVSLFLLFDLFRWKPSPLVTALLTLFALFFYFSARGLLLGQPGLLVCFLEILAIWAIFRSRDRLAGVALAISTLKPQMGFLIVPFFLLWSLSYRRWQFLVAFVLTMIVLLLTSFLFQPSWLSDWLAQLGLYPTYTALGSPVWIITDYYLGLGNWAEYLLSGALALYMLWAWYVSLYKNPGHVLWAITITLTITHLIAPRTATPHYVIFLLPLIFYFAYWSRVRQRWFSWWILASVCLLTVIPWVHFLLTVDGEFEHPTLYLPLPFLTLILLVLSRRLWWSFDPESRRPA